MANPGNDHKAYVGPAEQFDLMGATQFSLLCTLGLRSHHKLLDVGCGALRAGRLFIQYLQPGHYYGIEPNRWLVEKAVSEELGQQVIEKRCPEFVFNAEFDAQDFETKFDFILAQSIFSHCGEDLIHQALASFRQNLAENGLVLATFVKSLRNWPGSGWVYPGCVGYRHGRIKQLARQHGLNAVPLPWYHPRQTWYLLANKDTRIPGFWQRRRLKGVMLQTPAWSGSYSCRQRMLDNARNLIKNSLSADQLNWVRARLIRRNKSGG